MAQVSSRAWIILVAHATWLRFEFSFMNGSSFEPCSIILVAYATWLGSRFGFMSQSNTGLDMLRLTL